MQKEIGAIPNNLLSKYLFIQKKLDKDRG